MRLPFALLLLLMLIVSGTLVAQSIKISGTVTGVSGELLESATVHEKGGAKTVQTQKDGKYSINVSPNAVLTISHIGYTVKETPVNNRQQINISLVPEDKSLEQVVVIGYGTQKRKDLTGAISSVSGTELAKVPVQNVAQAMQGRLAGVQVTMADGSPGAQPSIKIRGGTSISQSNQPLYVVDGVPQTDGISFLDPTDIESVDVLKDASATAIYGARGANGVVLITTKQIKAGKVTVNYDGYAGAKKMTKEIPLMDAYQYLVLDYERRLSDSTKITSFRKLYGSFDSLRTIYGNRKGMDWQDVLFGSTVWNQFHKISVSGGSKETKFNIFYSRNKDQGIILNSGSVKNIGKIMLNHKSGDRFIVNAIAIYSSQKITGLPPTEGGNARLTVLQSILQYRPVGGRAPADDNALINMAEDSLDNLSSPVFQSPTVATRSRLRERVITTLNANATIQYNLTQNLTYRGLISYTAIGNNYKQFNTSESIVAIRSGGPFGSIDNENDSRLNYNNILTYSNTFKKDHKIDITLGQEYIYNYAETFGTSSSRFPAVNNGWNDLSLGTIIGTPSSHAEDDKLLSFFGRLNYNYKDKYLLTASLRGDGSSKFGKNNYWGIFPSTAIAWRMINEDFMKQLPIFSDMKLRVSYGQAGNNRISNYAALGIYTTGSYPLNNNVVPSAYENNLPNPYLKWEANQSFNIGLDLGILNQRMTLTTEVYDNRSKGLLFNTRVPASSGFTTQFQNIGTTSSRGVEFTLNTSNIKNNNFRWNTSFNIAFNKTKVIALSPGETSKIVNSYTTLNDYILEVGKPVGIMYGYVTDGLYQVSDFNYTQTTQTYTLKDGVVKDNRTVQPGFQKFKDISGPNGTPDGVISDNDRTEIGNANPKYTGGINNTFSYKGFDLSVFLNFAVGNNIYNANVLNNAALSNDYKNSFARFADRWMTINTAGQRVTDPTELAALNKGKIIPSYIGMVSDRLYNTIIEDGSFLRINTVSIGYAFPRKWLQKVKISAARIFFTGYNLHVFTKYSGYDPEVSTINNAITPGVDFSAYPRASSFVAGLNLSL